ncbi:cytochrome P450 [Fusarium albosuccineum]|uniref:Cytochrome P450 n=1 Tax=Fusarium albosuccineum TaxID=1237068 RepID=A0A8H4L1H2_9HYPO|nr:cytochrome P450 [Fusarium albosuccineum]
MRSSTAALILAVLTGTSWLIFKVIYNVFFHPLRKYPGPPLWAMSRIPYTTMYLSGNGPARMLEIHQKYGETVCIGPNQLSFLNPDAWKQIMGHRKPSEPENTKVPNFFRGGNNTILGADRESHSQQRRLLSHGFSAQAMMEQQPTTKGYVDLLIKKLHENGGGGSKSVDAVAWLNFTTFDLIGDLSVGEPFGSLRNGNYHPWVALIFGSIQAGAYSFAFSQFPLLSALMRMFVPREIKQKAKDHDGLTRHLVDKRLAMDNDRLDFLSAITKSRGSATLSKEQIYGNAGILIIAGSETTATALSGQLYYLCQTPAVMQKLEQEVRNYFKSEEEIDLLSVQKLSYMGACLEEGLRLYPPVPMGVPRITTDDTILFGQHVPRGTTLEIWQWPMYHKPEYFKDADKFIPERWLGDSRFATDRLETVQPFSFGPRNCIGKNLAYAEMRLILSRLIWNFDITLAEESKEWVDECFRNVYTLYDKPGLRLYLTPRQVQ